MRRCWWVGVEMPDFDVEAFVAKLESLGVKLTAVPLADGRTRINRWRMPHAVDAIQIESLWASQIGNNQGRIDLLAAHLAPASATVFGSGALPIRAIPSAGAGDAKSKDRPATTASAAAPVRPVARAAEAQVKPEVKPEVKSKDKPEVTGGSALARPSARIGESDPKSKDRPTGRPNSIGPSASPVPARPPFAARRNG
jgi:hypothetical protein